MEQMTLFYSKRTGEIKYYCTGVQNMEYFGSDKEDYEVIFGFIVVDKDDMVIDNRDKFIVQDGQVKLKSTITYPTAT